MTGLQPPAVPVFYPGVGSTAQLNTMVQAFTFLLAKVAFRARRTTSGSPTKNAHTDVPWTTIDEDNYGGWAAGQPTRYTCQAPGWYLVSGTLSLTGTGAGGTVLIPACAVNGASQTGQGSNGWEGAEVFIPTGGPLGASGIWEVYCNVGDYIELDCWYSGEPAANLSWNTASDAQTRIEIVWMGV